MIYKRGKHDFGCSNTMPKNDKRRPLWKKQRLTRGFDDTEIYSLDLTLFKFLKPRLKVLVKKRDKYLVPNERTEKLKELSKMLDKWDEESLLDDEAYDLLTKYIGSMWY